MARNSNYNPRSFLNKSKKIIIEIELINTEILAKEKQ